MRSCVRSSSVHYCNSSSRLSTATLTSYKVAERRDRTGLDEVTYRISIHGKTPHIVNRGEWFGSSANIKGANKDAKI